MKKKRCGFIVFVIESAAASRGIPNKYVGKLFHTPLERTFIPGVVFQKRLQLCITTPWHLCKRFGLGPVVIWPQSTSTTYYSWVEIYTHPRISQRDFLVMHFVALQLKSKKDDKSSVTREQSGLYNNYINIAIAKLLCKLLK